MEESVKRSNPASSSADGSASNDIAEVPVERLLELLEDIPDQIGRLIANYSRENLQQAAQDGGWGAIEILSHLQDWEEVTHERVWRILDEDCPELEEYDDSFWAIDHEYGARDGHQVFANIHELRQELLERLRSIDDESWERAATLAGRGEISLLWLMRNLARHDSKNIARIREALG